ncbi:MAG: UDP-N-acetylglucosamine 1-carboxyvinyltransferase [Thermodesulfobacteriota bacterium]
MDKILMQGGHRLAGTVAVSGSKNAALPILASSLLCGGTHTYTNVPELMDIKTFIQVLKHLGARVSFSNHQAEVDTAACEAGEAPYDLVRRMRASVLVLGPMVARFRKARVSLPGGCAIGARPIDLHLKGLEAMGASVDLSHGYVDVTADRLTGADIYLDMPTVTGTENLMMAACLAKGQTVLRNVAREPEIVALAQVLCRMGAKVEGAGTNVITVDGVEELRPAAFRIIPDRIEAGTFLVAAALTRGDVTVTDMEPAHVQALIHKLRLTGAEIAENGTSVHVKGPDRIVSTDVTTLPHPGFPTDMQAQFMVLMCLGDGSSVITETIFENRFIHVSELLRMGARISISGNAAVIKGVKRLSAAPVMATDLRASACLVLAGLVAEGQTEINRVYHIDRGYEAIERKLAGLGAVIARVR